MSQAPIDPARLTPMELLIHEALIRGAMAAMDRLNNAQAEHLSPDALQAMAELDATNALIASSQLLTFFPNDALRPIILRALGREAVAVARDAWTAHPEAGAPPSQGVRPV